MRFFCLVVLAVALACGRAAPAPELRLVDLAGSPVDPFATPARVNIFVFIRSDCPISNRYAPVLRELAAGRAERDVRFWIVYVDPEESADAIRRHVAEYGLPGTPLLDVHHDLVHLTGATVTPEAAVFPARGTMAYRGRIDDRHVDFGKTRPEPTRHDLSDAIDALLDGRPVPERTTPAVGCFIRDLEPRTSSEDP